MDDEIELGKLEKVDIRNIWEKKLQILPSGLLEKKTFQNLERKSVLRCN